MVRTGSCFAQVLSLVNRADFERAVRRHEAEKWAKGFSCWDQFAAMPRLNLLTYRDLWAWLDAPFQVLIEEPAFRQLSFLPG